MSDAAPEHTASTPIRVALVDDEPLIRAGLRTILCVRPGNPPITAPHDHPTTSTFADLI